MTKLLDKAEDLIQIEDGYYRDNPDEAIKDFKRIMTKVRKQLN